MRMYDIIQKKRDGHALTQEEIQWFIDGYIAGDIPDYQVGTNIPAYIASKNGSQRLRRLCC